MRSDPCEIVYKSVTQRKRLARRALEAKLGRALRPGEVTRHRCDVAGCVRPAHLEVGSQGDNNRDTAQRRRSNGSQRKLYAGTRLEIARRYLFGGITQEALAREYGVSQVAVSQYARRLQADAGWEGLLCSF